MFKVIGTNTYLKEIQKWSKVERDFAEKVPIQLSNNPFVGKPLGFNFLREKKIGIKRIYYLVYEDLELVLLVATSEKKDQQATINHIKYNLDEFKKLAQEIIKQVS